MSDLLSLAIMASVAVSCGLTVALGEYLYRCLAKQSHGDGSNADGVVGDIPFLPNDFEPFHSTCVTDGGQPNNGAR